MQDRVKDALSLFLLKLDKKIPGQGFAARALSGGATSKPGTGLTIGQLLEGVKEKPLLSRKRGAAQDSKYILLHRPDRLSFDAASQRHFDENGFLHVALSPISKECVNDYYGHEIPGWRELGLDPNRIYKGYRPGPELEKAASTFNGLNILSEHIKDGADNPAKDYTIGSMGTDAVYKAPYLKNSLIIKCAKAIELLSPADPNTAPKREISASYRYDPEFKAGTFDNTRYDFIMTNLRGNHIALVEEGRAGADVVVADGNPNPERKKTMEIKDVINALIAALKGVGVTPHEGAEEGKALEVGDAPPESKPTACDDALGAALTELFALAGSVQDEELANKLKAIGEAIRASQGSAEDVDPAKEVAKDEGNEDKKDEVPAMDKKTMTAKKDGNVYNFTVPVANDAAIARSVEEKMYAKFAAARDVRGLVGEIDPLAFDSAAGIYQKALEVAGHKTKVTDVEALREMVRLACDAQPKGHAYPVISGLMNDAKDADTVHFAHLKNIRKA